MDTPLFLFGLRINLLLVSKELKCLFVFLFMHLNLKYEITTPGTTLVRKVSLTDIEVFSDCQTLSLVVLL